MNGLSMGHACIDRGEVFCMENCCRKIDPLTIRSCYPLVRLPICYMMINLMVFMAFYLVHVQWWIHTAQGGYTVSLHILSGSRP
jgi:hypothetical protein